jgi:hypothetical protein
MVTEKNPLKEAHFLDDLKRTRLVLGSITSSIHLLNGPDGKEGMFFAFPDISIRIEGIFRIKVCNLFILNMRLFLTFCFDESNISAVLNIRYHSKGCSVFDIKYVGKIYCPLR